MQLSWHIICSEKSLSRMTETFRGRSLQVTPYWKDRDCLELYCTYESDMDEELLIELCSQICGTNSVQIDRQPTGTEFACYVTLDEIKNDGKAFVVCFVNIKENEL